MFRVSSDREQIKSMHFSESRKQKHEHLVQIYTPQFFIDTLTSSTKRLYVWIYIDDIDVTRALL